MGTFACRSEALHLVIDDHLLAHVEALIGVRLRCCESFFLTWAGERGAGVERLTLWVDASITMRLRYDSAEPFELDPWLLDQLNPKRTTAWTSRS